MQIQTLKDLQKVIVACQKLGVRRIKMDGLELELGSMPQTQTKPRLVSEDIVEGLFNPGDIPMPQITITPNIDRIETDLPSQEDLLYYSSESQEEVL